MARMRDRVFAGMGALLFFGSACALTVFVILNPGKDNASNTSAQTSQQQACSDTSTSEPTLAVPDIYKPGGAVTELQTTDLEPGTGPAAKDGDCLVVKYYGTLASNGTKFDENFTSGSAFAFTLGQGQVIQGWDKGMVGLKAGGMRRLVIPAALGYGSQSPSSSIPANSDLVFVVKLLRVQNS
jgi:FKBP-type peptidyl-prolyl cis-trans isomerase